VVLISGSIIPGTSGTINTNATTQTIYYNGSSIGIDTPTTTEKLTVKGNLQLKDADPATKAYRFRTSGASLDFDAAGSTMYFSNYSNANFTGTQNFYLGFNSASHDADAFGAWRFHDVPFAATKVAILPTESAPLQVTGDISTENGDLILGGSSTNTLSGSGNSSFGGQLNAPTFEGTAFNVQNASHDSTSIISDQGGSGASTLRFAPGGVAVMEITDAGLVTRDGELSIVGGSVQDKK
jgi:hypothetical protein